MSSIKYSSVSYFVSQVDDSENIINKKEQMKNMEKATIFNQMSQYDFSTPINTTIIFEEESDDESLYKNTSKEQNKSTENAQESFNDEELVVVSAFFPLKCEVDNIINKNISIKDEKRKISLVDVDLTDVDLTEVDLTEIDLEKDKKTNKDQNKIKTEVDQAMDCEEIVSNTKENTQTCSSPDSTNMKPDNKIVVINKQNVSPTVSSSQDISKDKCNKVSEIYNQINGNAELTAYVKDLLNTLSEHLILIMKPYYHFYHFRGVGISPELTGQLNRLKTHFFDLSYSTVVSLILPQENNKAFIEKFIDKTVADANKIFNWNCSRQHVEPFYNEMIEWAKQKRNHIKKLGMLRSNHQGLNVINSLNYNSINDKNINYNNDIENRTSNNIINQQNNNAIIDNRSNENRIIENGVHGMAINENSMHSNTIQDNNINRADINIILKERLAEPIRPFNSPHPTGAASVAQLYQMPQNTNTESVCIFSSGTPGREVSINMNPETYHSHSSTQLYTHLTHEPTKKKPRKSKSKVGSKNPSPPVQQPNWPQNQWVHQVQQNIYSHGHTVHHPPVPRAPPPAYGFQPPTAVPQAYHHNSNQIHNNYSHPHVRQNYNTHGHHPMGNTTNFGIAQSPSPEALSTPVITNVTSLNPNAYQIGRCSVCGKSCMTRCSKCQKLSYCSYLCQELDASIHQAICNKT